MILPVRSTSLLVLLGISVSAAAGAPADVQGQRLFLRCASCHSIAPTQASRIGPTLNGVVGRKAGSVPGFAYSPAMKSVNFVWDETMLDKWLTKPGALVPGTSMGFGGLAKAEDRQALITYLKKAGGKP